jgi:predicted anti-sigma-YlaC factor YlaD
MKWMTTCKETTELVSRAMDEGLSLGDRVAMKMHLAICTNCRRFTRQIHAMRRLFRLETRANDDAPGLAPEARQRIANELQNKLDS